MKSKLLTRMISSLLAVTLLFGICPAGVKASDAAENGDNVVISDSDKPYLSLGEDLTDEQRETVLGLMGISADDLDQYDVNYVTNEEEHEYLDSYIDSSTIGTKAYSSVVITEAKKGSGLSISTYNINYCTVGMYKNALTTAGITDANIIVAGPFEISGTAALIGIYKAYEDMTGEDISDDLVDASLDELVTTGDIISELDDVDSTQVEAIIAELKQMLADGKLDSDEQMSQAIDDLANEYGVTFTDQEKQEIINLLRKLKSLNLDWDLIGKQAVNIIEKAKELGNTEAGKNFIQSIIDFIKSLFS